MFKKVNPRQNFPEMEKEIIKFWEESKTFEKSVKNRDGKKNYSFYDGPPFATGLPHYGHIVASLMKDVVPRYWTMRGYQVKRRWGWDCHGLPIENLIEKELDIKNKQEIEKLGVDKFNQACRASVLRYVDEWKKFISRIGRWVDMEHDYKTMDPGYTESIWWVFSELYKKGLIYESYKSMHLCPRCGTTLSNFEVTQGYKDITDLSATVKFKLKAEQKIRDFKVDKNSFMLAWTTTPWTLPGNIALAIGENIKYAIVKIENDFYVLAKDRIEEVLKDKESEVLDEIKGKDLVGLEYEPLFDYYSKKEDLENRENGWKIYAGDFVTTEEGTGVVHIAPAFGEDDMELAEQYNLPFIQHVKTNGRFADEVVDFKDKSEQGREVKPKRNPRETDEKVVEWLEENNKLFAKENYKHSYPCCWRCDTPLLNYATASWFVKATAIKKRMIKNNQEINWVPKYIKNGRFGKWLEEARDWAISRNRYWGAPIPIWRCGGKNEINNKSNRSHKADYKSKGCGNIIVVDSRKKLGELAVGGNTLIVARHGETDWNKKGRMLGWTDVGINETGRRQAEKLIGLMEKEKIDLVISSPLKRAYQTAEIVTQNKVKILKDDLLKERSMGDFEGMTKEEILEKYPETSYYLTDRKGYYWEDVPNGESFAQVKKRVDEFVEKINKSYYGKRILVFSHAGFLDMLYAKFNDNDYQKGFGHHGKNCSMEKYNLIEAVDLHRPEIDKIVLKCPKCDGEARRIPEVLDCWFESGSMPYAQWHYPFENREEFEKSFPANFIAEGLDQTRGWFYTLIVLSTALFNKPAFKNVIVNGIVLAENGQKMSKRLRNYPDPNLIIEKYGADALRYYLLSSPVMKSENLNFSERGVEEVLKKFILTLWNVYSFLVMSVERMDADEKLILTNRELENTKFNLLDRWILSELNILIKEVNKQMRDYDLVRASRPLREFVDKLSNWYLRRSRKRFNFSSAAETRRNFVSTDDNPEDRNSAFQTLHYVLVIYSKLLAPFTPFLAEEIYKNLTGEESVHLTDYPQADERMINKKLSESMNFVRQIVTLGLAARAKNSIKVRQPLEKLEIGNWKLEIGEELLNLAKDELNVKKIEFVDKIIEKKEWAYEEDGKIKIGLDMRITDELKREGWARELTRHIQAMRKEAKYNRDDVISVKYNFADENKNAEKVFSEWGYYLKKECLAEEVSFVERIIEEEFDLIKKLKLGEWELDIGIRKI